MNRARWRCARRGPRFTWKTWRNRQDGYRRAAYCQGLSLHLAQDHRNSHVLEKTVWPCRYVPIFRVIGEEFEIEGKVKYQGLVRDMKDCSAHV